MPMPNAGLPSMSILSSEACRRLRLLREQHLKLSRPKFADKLGVSPLTLKNYELGYREIGGGFLLLLANHAEFKEHTLWVMAGVHPGSSIFPADTVSKLNP